jgi:hypothetical protein
MRCTAVVGLLAGVAGCAALPAGPAAGPPLVRSGKTSADQPPEPAKPIPASDLHNRPVIGRLDRPLGTIVVVEGVVADGSYTKAKGDEGQTLLRVRAVNGKRLAEEQVFYFGALLERPEKPRVGTTFNYSGYETGGFVGLPTKAFDYVGLIAIPGYAFMTNFVVLRVEAKPRD